MRGSKGRGKRGRGIDDVNYGRLSSSSSSAWISKKQSVHRGRSACPATRKRDALPPVHRNRTRLPRFAAPPASRCINTAKGGRSERVAGIPNASSSLSLRSLSSCFFFYSLFFSMINLLSRSPFVLVVDLY